ADLRLARAQRHLQRWLLLILLRAAIVVVVLLIRLWVLLLGMALLAFRTVVLWRFGAADASRQGRQDGGGTRLLRLLLLPRRGSGRRHGGVDGAVLGAGGLAALVLLPLDEGGGVGVGE
ncbi:MAG: hypothetical protein ACK559_20045, partial [bacterium]